MIVNIVMVVLLACSFVTINLHKNIVCLVSLGHNYGPHYKNTSMQIHSLVWSRICSLSRGSFVYIKFSWNAMLHLIYTNTCSLLDYYKHVRGHGAGTNSFFVANFDQFKMLFLLLSEVASDMLVSEKLT